MSFFSSDPRTRYQPQHKAMRAVLIAGVILAIVVGIVIGRAGLRRVFADFAPASLPQP